MASQKRRASGASTTQVQQMSSLQPNAYPTNQDTSMADQYGGLGWEDPTMMNNLGAAYTDSSLYENGIYNDANGVSQNDGTGLPTEAASYSRQLVKRSMNQQLAQRARTPWDSFGGDIVGQQPPGWENTDDDEDLESKALLAKRDAQSKRKQIPPFVQKLSSFLDEKKNTNLIRWSDDGNSFSVLDEDEFARTLIPELFKHNNYASFVRQLNMYGFHKKVGLSDNSMKASETKAKAPSEYFNKYFKRGRPELLWLIQKPKNQSSNPKRKRDEDTVKQGDSDDDGRRFGAEPAGITAPYGVDDGGGGKNPEMAMIPRTEYNSLKRDVLALQHQQKVISTVLNRIRQQNDELYQQATAFQTLHERHENSINAILTFLATFYSRSVEGQNGPNIAEMFAGTIPHDNQTHGNVVDVGDYPEPRPSRSPQLHRMAKRPLALLPAPLPKEATSSASRVTTVPSSARSAASPTVGTRPPARQSVFTPPIPPTRNSVPVSGSMANGDNMLGVNSTPPIKADAESPAVNQIPENSEIMSAIRHSNANSTQGSAKGAQYDFPAALTHFQNANGALPLTQQQRNDVLSLMANNASAASPNSGVIDGNNAMVSPEAPTMPSLDQFTATQDQLDFLQKMSEEQNHRLQNVQERLQPLSPSGSIPGIHQDDFGSYFNPQMNNLDNPSDLNLDDSYMDSFIHADDFIPNHQTNGDLPDFKFDISDPSNAGNDALFQSPDMGSNGFGNGLAQHSGTGTNNGGRIESVSSTATSPANTVEENGGDYATRSPKRRRKVD